MIIGIGAIFKFIAVIYTIIIRVIISIMGQVAEVVYFPIIGHAVIIGIDVQLKILVNYSFLGCNRYGLRIKTTK